MASLINRLFIREELDADPTIAERPIRKPMIIASLPRTGTTLLHHLLSLDPQARPLLFWESHTPVLRPRQRKARRDPRLRRARIINMLARGLFPRSSEIHHLDAFGPEECTLLFYNTLMSAPWALIYRRYGEWFMRSQHENMLLAYQEYKQQLQILSQSQPQSRRWVLKSPSHIYGIDALLETLGDASVVWIHRSPRQVVSSLCSLRERSYGLLYRDPDTPAKETPSRIIRQLNEGAQRMHHASGNFPHRICNVAYEELVQDPITVIGRIYRHFDIEMTDDAQQRFRSWRERFPPNKHGKHKHDFHGLGVTPQMVDETFRWYTSYYDLDT